MVGGELASIRRPLTELGLLTCVFLALASGSASAAKLDVTAGVLAYTAMQGEVNHAEFASDGDLDGLVYVYEYAAPVTLGAGCLVMPDPSPSPSAFVCRGVESATVLGNDLDDKFVGAIDDPVSIDGGSGNDQLWGHLADDRLDGGEGADRISGGRGDDVLLGGPGNDYLEGDLTVLRVEGGTERVEDVSGGGADELFGGAGDDLLHGNTGADTVSGGVGVDEADFVNRDVDMTIEIDGVAGDGAKGEGDNVLQDVEQIATGGGDDLVITKGSNGSANRVRTGAGNDRIRPGDGADVIDAGTGNDALELRDDATDVADCGAGHDVVATDTDSLTGCEQVERSTSVPVTGDPRVTARELLIAVRRVGRRAQRVRVRIQGRLILPAGAPVSLCARETVDLSVKYGAQTVRLRRSLKACRFSAQLRVRASRVSVRGAIVHSQRIVPIRSRQVRLAW